MQPKISVIIPVYNVERFLDEAIESVIEQSLDDLEILCINDGSLDRSLEILQQYASKDSRIRVIDQENAGYGAAVNRGLDAANGKYIAVVEPDDYIRKDMFDVLYKVAEETEAEVVKGDYSMFTDEKRFVQSPLPRFYGN